MERLTLRMTVTVTYDTHGVDQQSLEMALSSIMDRAAGDGCLTGGTDALVDDWYVRIETCGA